jgi:glycosyltransferase involved in cell wall biosynthesis
VDGRGEPSISLSVVVCTYEAPQALDAVLRALADQSDADFEIVVADDGSGPSTRAVVERWAAALPDRVAHVWQPDIGCSHIAAALNRGALAARRDFLVVLSGDCVPRQHFVRAFREAARPGWFVAVNLIWLSRELTERVLREQTPIHRWSTARLLAATRGGGPARNMLTRRDRRRVGRTGVPEFAPHNNTYCCIGVHTWAFAAVNGFDTRFIGWGDEDVDFATRVRRVGLRCGHAGPHAVPLHLWHESRRDPVRRNWALLKETERSVRVEAVEGLRELAAEKEAHVGAGR